MATTSVSRATLSAPSHTGSVSGKCRPRSPRPTAPSTASASAWQTASASLCPPRPARRPRSRRRPRTSGRCGSSEKRWTSMPWPMRTLTDCRAASSRSAGPRSSGSVILRLPARRAPPARCRPTPRPAWRRRWRRRPAAGVGPAQYGGPEGLRRLHRDQRGAIQRARDPSGLVHGLDRVTRRDTGHGAVRSPVGHRRDHGVEECGRGQRPRRVVHHDHRRRRRGPRPGRSAPSPPGWRHRGRPRRRRGRSAPSPRRRDDQDHAGGRGPARLHGPFEHRAAAQEGELLHRPKRRPEPPATTIDHTGATVRPGPSIRSGPRSGALRPSPRPR